MFASSKTILATLAVVLGTSNAVFLCGDYDRATGGCKGNTCTEYYIAMNQAMDTPYTTCIYNPATDQGFNLLVCDGTGNCNDMQKTSTANDIDGFYNWIVPATYYIKRIGD